MSYDCVCDYDQPSFYVSSKPVARKLHRCEECGSAIAAGEAYESAKGIWDGRFDVFKTCARCVALRDHLKAHVRCFCWAHGSLHEDISYCVQEMPAEARGSGLLFELGRLAVAIRRAPSFYSRTPTTQKATP